MAIKTNDPKSSALARGKRLKTVRMMTGLTRGGLEDKYNISASTIQSWEAAKAGGLTERGAQRIIPILQHEGIFCTVDWLLYGIGAAAHPNNFDFQPSQENYDTIPEDKAIIQELLTFRNLNTDVIDLKISDDGMHPFYKKGEYVAGKRRVKENISQLVGMDCIVETVTNQILLRRLKHGAKSGLYTLVCINPDSTVAISAMYDQALSSAAPVIWHRKKDIK